MSLRTLENLAMLCAPNTHCLTVYHGYFLEACIDCAMYSYAHSFLKNSQILEIDPKVTLLQPVDFLRYFYCAGVCYIAMKDYPTGK